MAGKKRKFETGFKKQLAAQIASGQITPTQAARVHNISPSVISYWRNQFRTGELTEAPTRREKALAREMETCKKRLAEARREIDLLRKQKELAQMRIKLNSSVITGLDFPPLKTDAKK